MTEAPRPRRPLELGPLQIWPPVVLAPMAGITNFPFRSICREFGAGLYVSEMIVARPLVDRNPRALRLAAFGPEETPRSLQLYGVDPEILGQAVRWLVAEGRVDHLDLNFGCPVPKITRKGGGAAIPLKPRLLQRLLRAAVTHAGDVPVTMKMRIGVDDQYRSYLEAGRIAAAEGCAAVGLHARTAAQLYSGAADWSRIARLKEVLSVPVLGNGDIWAADDALRMMDETGCDGVIVGRGCLGRPWLFRDLAAVFEGRTPPPPPRLGESARWFLEHARRLCRWTLERIAVLQMRRHAGWYLGDYPSGAALRARLVRAQTFEELAASLTDLDPDETLPEECLGRPRGKVGRPQRVVLPHGYLDQLDDDSPPDPEAEDATSGG